MANDLMPHDLKLSPAELPHAELPPATESPPLQAAPAPPAPAAEPGEDAPPPDGERNSYAVTALADIVDRSTHASLARFTAGLSPAAGRSLSRLGDASDLRARQAHAARRQGGAQDDALF